MRDAPVALKYAKALFEEARAKNQLLSCGQGLQEIVRVSRLKRSLREILGHPFIRLEEKRRVIASALGEYAMPLLERFFILLVRHKRFDLLGLILEDFQTLVDRFQNVQPLAVRSAFRLSEAQAKALKEGLEKWLGSKVRMNVQVDAKLIGGFVVQMPGRVLDESLAGGLKKLQAHLSAR